MENSKDPVDGTVTIDKQNTNIEDDEIVFQIRTADGKDIRVATSTPATKQLNNAVSSLLNNK